MSVFGVSTNRKLTASLIQIIQIHSLHKRHRGQQNTMKAEAWVRRCDSNLFKKSKNLALLMCVVQLSSFSPPTPKTAESYKSRHILWRAVERHSGKCRNSNKSGNSQGKLKTIKRQHLMRTWWVFSLKLFQSTLFYCSQQNNKLFFSLSIISWIRLIQWDFICS